MLCAVWLGGCFSSGKSTACYNQQEYRSSSSVEKLRVPDGLDTPKREGVLVIAEGPRAIEPVPKDQPCPDQPPDYFGLDSEVMVAAAPGAAAPVAVSQVAFRDDRAGEWNLSLEAVFLASEGSSGVNGSSIDVQDDWGFGFMVGYNFTNHLALGFEMNFLEPRYDYTFVPDEPNAAPQTISQKLTMFSGMLNGTYNVLQGPVTPFIDLSLGLTNLDSNVTDGPPVTGCWWDYWWGYVCRSYWSTYSDTIFSYGGGLGVRWDINDAIFLRASYNLLRIDTGSSSSDPTLDMGRIEIGWRR
jgi:opacity protein-like surface antigen